MLAFGLVWQSRGQFIPPAGVRKNVCGWHVGSFHMLCQDPLPADAFHTYVLLCLFVLVACAWPQNPNLQRAPAPPTQSVEEIQRLVQMARTVGPVQPNVIDTGAL